MFRRTIKNTRQPYWESQLCSFADGFPTMTKICSTAFAQDGDFCRIVLVEWWLGFARSAIRTWLVMSSPTPWSTPGRAHSCCSWCCDMLLWLEGQRKCVPHCDCVGVNAWNIGLCYYVRYITIVLRNGTEITIEMFMGVEPNCIVLIGIASYWLSSIEHLIDWFLLHVLCI